MGIALFFWPSASYLSREPYIPLQKGLSEDLNSYKQRAFKYLSQEKRDNDQSDGLPAISLPGSFCPVSHDLPDYNRYAILNSLPLSWHGSSTSCNDAGPY